MINFKPYFSVSCVMSSPPLFPDYYSQAPDYIGSFPVMKVEISRESSLNPISLDHLLQ